MTFRSKHINIVFWEKMQDERYWPAQLYFDARTKSQGALQCLSLAMSVGIPIVLTFADDATDGQIKHLYQTIKDEWEVGVSASMVVLLTAKPLQDAMRSYVAYWGDGLYVPTHLVSHAPSSEEMP